MGSTDSHLKGGIFMKKWNEFLKNQSGSVGLEYGLIGTLIGVVLVASITAIGTNTTVTMDNISNQF